jgi:hypothetical protein
MRVGGHYLKIFNRTGGPAELGGIIDVTFFSITIYDFDQAAQ